MAWLCLGVVVFDINITFINLYMISSAGAL